MQNSNPTVVLPIDATEEDIVFWTSMGYDIIYSL